MKEMQTDSITMKEFKKLDLNKIYLLDVRELKEWQETNIPQAVLIPINKVMDKLFDLPQKEKIYVICRVGNRSGFIRTMLNLNGYKAINVLGGMELYNILNKGN